jgi:Spy/CpxP family protein refolding chaperone
MNQMRMIGSVGGAGMMAGAIARALSRGLRVGRVVAALGLGAALLVATPQRASAQGMMGRMSSMGGMDPGATAISRRSLEDYAKILGLDDDQKDVAKTLLDGYRDAHRAAIDEMQAKMEAVQEKIRDTKDWSLYQTEMPKVGMEFGDKIKTLEKTLMEDVKGILTPAQLEKWGRVEAHRRRDAGLKVPFFSGAAVDLIRITDRAKLGAGNKEFAELIAAYETEMDRRLVVFEKKGEELEQEFKEPGKLADMSAQMKALDDLGGMAKDIRDLNRDYSRRISGVLSEDERAKFETEFNRRSWPRVYRESHTARQLAAAAGFSDLDASQKETVDSLKAQYTREAASLNNEWTRAIDNAEDKAGGTFKLMMAEWGAMGGEKSEDLVAANNSVKEARKARSELDDRIRKRLQEVLNSEQKDRLPARKAENSNPWMDFMPEMGDGEDEE